MEQKLLGIPEAFFLSSLQTHTFDPSGSGSVSVSAAAAQDAAPAEDDEEEDEGDGEPDRKKGSISLPCRNGWILHSC